MSIHHTIELTAEQRQELEHLVRTGSTSARTYTRARILLLSDRQPGAYLSAPAIAKALIVHPNTVRNVRRRFIAEGLTAALQDKPRPGAQPKLNGVLEAQLTALACSEAPDGHAHWTLRLLAEQLVVLEYIEAVSHTTVGEWLKKTNSSRGG